MIKGIFHLNINCSNLERSLEFYKSLGFHVSVDFPHDDIPQDGTGLGSRKLWAAA